MFLSVVLFVLFMAGCWLYCLIDAALTPAAEFPWLSKRTWIALIAVTLTLGALAWMAARSVRRARPRPRMAAEHPAMAGLARERHPAGRPRKPAVPPRPIGPDDDLEFLRMLGRLIHGGPDQGE